MSLIDFTIQLQRTNELLERQALALESISRSLLLHFPIPPDREPHLSTLTDLSYADPERIAARESAGQEFARVTNTTYNSEAYLQAKQLFERMISESYGPEAVQKLDWNR